jgi:hypothetical protein
MRNRPAACARIFGPNRGLFRCFGAIAFLGGLSIVLGSRARIGAWLIVLFLAAVTPDAQLLGHL